MVRSQGVQETTTQDFVREWFDLLSNHEPVDRLLPYLSDIDLEMVFPERTIRGTADFLDWYAVVGRAFTDQTHTVERLVSTANGDGIDVALTVVWAATQTSDGTRSAFRVQQTWRLATVPGRPRPVIVRYRVVDLQEI